MAGAARGPRCPLGSPGSCGALGEGSCPARFVSGSDSLKHVSVVRLPRERDNWSNCFCKFSGWYSACKAACHWATRAMWAVASFSANQNCLFSMGSAYSCKGLGLGFWVVGVLFFSFPFHRTQSFFLFFRASFCPSETRCRSSSCRSGSLLTFK